MAFFASPFFASPFFNTGVAAGFVTPELTFTIGREQTLFAVAPEQTIFTVSRETPQ
jgi:hypothetical protein